MELKYPKYYKAFSCIAAACPDSCCKEWDVDVDPKTASMYRALPGTLGDRLRRVLADGDDGWATMTITADRRCPMWRSDGLCAIQAELGHEALCGTCRDFPRLRHDYGDFMELGLELSCPEAARLILASSAPEYTTETVPGGTAPEYNSGEIALLKRSRTEALTLLRNETVPLSQALTALLLYGYDVHNALAFGDELPSTLISEEYLSSSALLAQPGSMAEIFALLGTLEILTPDWQTLLDAGPTKRDWLPEHRALACYLVERYWLQAISDLDLLCRVKFIIIACLIVRSLNADVLRAAQLFSKEIENDADNVEALLDAAYTSPAMTDAKLLGLLRE